MIYSHDFKNNYIVLDIETTGLHPEKDSITEIGAIKVIERNIVDEFNMLVNPQCHISSFITNLTGISNNLVKNSPVIKDVLPLFFDFIEDLPIIAHNANFDIGFIKSKSYKFLNKQFTNKYVDTLFISRKIFPHFSTHKLGYLVKALNLKGHAIHRALDDCYCTHYLYEHMHELSEIKLPKNINKTHILNEKICVFTGTFKTFNHNDAPDIINRCGGVYANNVTKKTHYLIVGDKDIRTNEKSTKQKKAEEYIKDGQNIIMISEVEFVNIIKNLSL